MGGGGGLSILHAYNTSLEHGLIYDYGSSLPAFRIIHASSESGLKVLVRTDIYGALAHGDEKSTLVVTCK